jgi:hypothetical protein
MDSRSCLRKQLPELLILLALAASKHDKADIGNLREKLVSVGVAMLKASGRPRRMPQG